MAEKVHAPIDREWHRLEPLLEATFTTQMFRTLIERELPAFWGALEAKYGSGGKASGEFYSPNNVLYNCLRDHARVGNLVRVGWVPSGKGWGTGRVVCWRKPDSAFISQLVEITPSANEEDRDLIEGEPKFVKHFRRERARGVRKLLIDDRLKTGLVCEICGITGSDLPEDVRQSMFEAHHASQPISAGKTATKLSDLALLCACCHRIIHRLVVARKKWVTVTQARNELSRGI